MLIRIGFADYGKRVVFGAFDGGEITSDAGVLLLREQARRIVPPIYSICGLCQVNRIHS